MTTQSQLYRKILLLKPEYPAYFLCGSRGGGKTVVAEWIASWYYERGYLVMAMWGSFDMENAFYCIGEPARTGKKVGYPVLIIHPRTTIVTVNEPLCVCGEKMLNHDDAKPICPEKKQLIKTVTDDTSLADILVQAHHERRIIVFNRGFYGNQKEAYRRLATILNQYPYLIVRKAIPSEISVCMIFNELGNIAPSGLKGMSGIWETNTKREIQTLIREARHVRTVMVADLQRKSDAAKSISDQRDYLIFKRSTKDLLPQDYEWMYESIERRRREMYQNLDFDGAKKVPSLSRLKPWQAYVVFPDMTYELRLTGMPPFRHKKPDDTWVDLANVTIDYIEKDELKTAEIKAKAILAKSETKNRKLDALKDAESLLAEGATFEEAARKVGWLGKDGKPSPDGLRMARRRAIQSGQLEPKAGDSI